MDFPVVPLSVLLSLLAIVLFTVHRLLTPTVPLKGKTNIPGPTEGIRWPILGDALWFMGAKTSTDLFVVLQRLSAMRDKLMSFYLGGKLIIFVVDAKILEAIINVNKCQAKDEDSYEPLNRISNGLFTKNGKGWSDMRRPLDRLLHTKHADDFHSVFTDKAKLLCTKIGKKCGKGVFEVNHFMDPCMLDIFTENILHFPGTQQIKETLTISKFLPESQEWVFQKMLQIYGRIEWLYRLTPLYRTEKKLTDGWRPSLQKMVDDCRTNLQRKGLNPADPDFEPENFIEVAIQRGIIEKKTEDETVFSFLDLIIAFPPGSWNPLTGYTNLQLISIEIPRGYDTSNITTSTLLLYLAMHPEYQEKIYQEQIEVMTDSLEAPSREQLSRMNYLDMVFNETLRHVSVPGIARATTAQFTIDGYVFPEGASLYIAYNHISKDRKYWERPNDFYPDHFLPENVAKRPKGAFLPFSFGGRSCPGKLFALHSNKLTLSMLLRRFKFTTNLKYEEMVYKYFAMVESAKGYPLEVTARVNLSDGA